MMHGQKNIKLWTNILGSGQPTDGSRIRPMHFACGISTTIDTGCHYFQLTPFPLLQWLRERAAVLCLNFLFTGKCPQGKQSVSKAK